MGLLRHRNTIESELMKKQSGNALWFILIAIFLLGGLTVLLSRTGSNTEETGSTEKSRIIATEILRYAASIENAVQFLLTQGCSENELSFWYDSNGDGNENASDDNYNPTSPTDRSCHIFSQKGAGITYKNMAILKFGTSGYAGAIGIHNSRYYGGIGPSNKVDLYYSISARPEVFNSVCEEIHKIGGRPPVATNTQVLATTTTKFTGVFPNYPTGEGAAWLASPKYACAFHNAARTAFAYLLLGR